MGVLKSHLSQVSSSPQRHSEMDPGRVLPCLWVQPQICHQAFKRSTTPEAQTQDTGHDLWPSGNLHPNRCMGGGCLPMVGTPQSPTPSLVALDQEAIQSDPSLESQILRISPATIDRRLKGRKQQLKRKLYGRTKPGTLLKHHIPLKTEHWDVTVPGFTEVDLVSHSGNCAEGEFIHSLNLTDIHTTWVETRAVMGKGQLGVLEAMNEIRHTLPFELKGIDSDNDSAFINYHLKAFCDQRGIVFTRSRPYKKDDNAHVEQKNWTHVRKLFGYVRYDSHQALETMNNLYRNELRLFYNLFLPSVKLIRKERIGSRIQKIYDSPKTPFERLCASSQADPNKVAELKTLSGTLNPFELSKSIDQKLECIYQMAHQRRNHIAHPTAKTSSQTKQPQPLSKIERETMKIISEVFGIPAYVRTQKPPGK